MSNVTDLAPYSIEGWAKYEITDLPNGKVEVWVEDEEGKLLYCLRAGRSSPNFKALMRLLKEDELEREGGFKVLLHAIACLAFATALVAGLTLM